MCSSSPTVSALILHLERYCSIINKHTFIHVLKLEAFHKRLSLNSHSGLLFRNSAGALHTYLNKCLNDARDSDGLYKCRSCRGGEYFRTTGELWQHLRSSSGEAGTRYNCSKYRRKYELPSGLLQYVESRSCRR